MDTPVPTGLVGLWPIGWYPLCCRQRRPVRGYQPDARLLIGLVTLYLCGGWNGPILSWGGLTNVTTPIPSLLVKFPTNPVEPILECIEMFCYESDMPPEIYPVKSSSSKTSRYAHPDP